MNENQLTNQKEEIIKEVKDLILHAAKEHNCFVESDYMKAALSVGAIPWRKIKNNLYESSDQVKMSHFRDQLIRLARQVIEQFPRITIYGVPTVYIGENEPLGKESVTVKTGIGFYMLYNDPPTDAIK